MKKSKKIKQKTALKLHWFCFAYIGKDSSGTECQACTYTGYPRKEITLKMIYQNKKNAGVTKKAVLISVSYLGYMNRSKFVYSNEHL